MITFQENNKTFTIQTKKSSYQMTVNQYNHLIHLYYGKTIQGAADGLLSYLDRGFSGNPSTAGERRTYSLDVLPQEFPTLGTGDYRQVAAQVKNADQSRSLALEYRTHKVKRGKYALKGLPAVYADEEDAETLEIYLEDPISNVEVCLYYGVLPELDVITRSAKITNSGNGEIEVERFLTACLDFTFGNYDVITFYGRHCVERLPQREAVTHGCKIIESKRGTSSHQYNPAVILAEEGATETHGNCYGMLFAYSGGFLATVEQDQFSQTRIMMGLTDEQFSYALKEGESLIAPEVILSFSDAGFETLTHNYHDCIQKHVCRSEYRDVKRPILINSWEAAYFDFDGQTIVNLAKEAKKMGMEMVVMDDGWFGKRDDDNSGLGDWVVNEKKLGCSLEQLIKDVNDQGMKFGIWIEPEMISEDSDLYRAHPDWAMKIPGRDPIRARNQLVLDFSRKEIVDYIFDAICKILDKGNVEYVKWDMNRSICDIYSMSTKQGNVMYDYILGLYDFLERLTTRYPHILIEGCSGGGGRFDAGMLYYTPQIWCSDNTDAANRVEIQYGTSYFYPAITMGAHVSAVPNHQTGRTIPLKCRSVVAMGGTYGFELDPQKLSAEEKAEVKEEIETFNQFEHLIHHGDYYRLSNPMQDEVASWAFVSKDKKEALVSYVELKKYGNNIIHYLKLRGLAEDKVYLETFSGKKYYGSLLMNAGIVLEPKSGDYISEQFHFIEA